MESVYVVRGETSPELITSSLQGLLPSRQQPIVRHRFTVLDTFDGRVRRAGGCLRRGGDNGPSTIVWQPIDGGQLTLRVTQPVSFVWDLPDGPLQQALASVVGVRRLLAQADIEQFGSLLEILDDRGKTVARLRIESGRARLPESRQPWQVLPTVISLKGLRGYEEVCRRLVPVIESRPGIESCREGLHGVALRQVGAPEHRYVSLPRVELDPAVGAEVGSRQIHFALLEMLIANEPGIRANLDTEFLHDFRVAVRRTRALLGQIRHIFSADVVAHFATEFSWLGRLTGPLRDVDVLVHTIREHRADIPAGDMEVLTVFLSQVQQQELERLIDLFDGDRYKTLLAEWKTCLQRDISAEREGGGAAETLADAVSLRAWRLSRRIAASGKTLDEQTPAERLHEIRIDAKKLRYLIDVTSTLYAAGDLKRILRALKKLQRVLGDFNDAHIQEKRLIEFGHALRAAGGSAGALLALGRLAEQSRQRHERLRDKVVDRIMRFGEEDTQSACRRAFKRAGAVERAR